MIPGWINAHSLTDDQMIVLDAMALEACRILQDTLHQHDRGEEGKDYGRGRRGRWPLIAGDSLVMVAEREANLPLDHGIHEQPHHREHRQGGNPFGFLQPHRTDGRRVFDPAKAWFHGDMLLLIRLEYLDIRPHRRPQRRGQDRPPLRLVGGNHGLWGHDEPIADGDRGWLRLPRTAATRAALW